MKTQKKINKTILGKTQKNRKHIKKNKYNNNYNNYNNKHNNNNYNNNKKLIGGKNSSYKMKTNIKEDLQLKKINCSPKPKNEIIACTLCKKINIIFFAFKSVRIYFYIVIKYYTHL